MPLKKMAKAMDSTRRPLESSSQNALQATRKRTVKLRTTASSMLTRNATALAGETGRVRSNSARPIRIGARPRLRRW